MTRCPHCLQDLTPLGLSDPESARFRSALEKIASLTPTQGRVARTLEHCQYIARAALHRTPVSHEQHRTPVVGCLDCENAMAEARELYHEFYE